VKATVGQLRESIRAVLVENLTDDVKAAFARYPKDGSVYLRFESADKIGLNPGYIKDWISTFPGIYAHPLLPAQVAKYFAGNLSFSWEKYIHFLRAKHPENMIDFRNIDHSRAFQILKTTFGDEALYGQLKKDNGDQVESAFHDGVATSAIMSYYDGHTAGDCLFDAIYAVVGYLTMEKGLSLFECTTMFRRAGIEGFIHINRKSTKDTNGMEEIKFFSIKNIEVLETVINPLPLAKAKAERLKAKKKP
jgi:hypothetical protein